MWKWILLIIGSIYIVPIIIDTIKAKDKMRFLKSLTKKQKIISVVILILIVILMPSYFIGKSIILKNKVRETVEKSEIYKYVDSYETKGFENSTINLNVNDGFGKLDDNTKLKYSKEIDSSVNSTIHIYGDIDTDDLPQLVHEEKVIINASEGQYKFQYESLEKPDGKEIREINNNSSNSSATTKSYTNDKTLRSGQSIVLNKDELVCSSKANLDKLLSFINKKNKDGENQMLLNGQATFLRKGTKLNVIDAGIAVSEIETSNGQHWFTTRETLQDAL